MAVLIEAISVVIKRSAIDEKFESNWEGFVADVPNETLCADDELARVGFMTPIDVKSYVKYLEKLGFKYQVNGSAVDLVVVDQQRGFAAPCNWAEFGFVNIDNNRIAACRAVDGSNSPLLTPDEWEYEGSLSQTFGFVPSEHIDKSLAFLRHEAGLDVYCSALTGKEVFIGRTWEK